MKNLENKRIADKETDIKNFVCIMCPKGCRLKVDVKNGYSVAGNGCSKGAEYGKKEAISPERLLTSTVEIKGGIYSRCPVKTDREIPKPLMFRAMELINAAEVYAPVRRGDIVISDILGTGANIIITKNMDVK
jgi:CxxC motif-containing protein